MKEQCQVEGCNKPAKFSLYKINPYGGGKTWLNVCDIHEGEIGQENLKRAGGYLTAKELEDFQAMKDANRIKG